MSLQVDSHTQHHPTPFESSSIDTSHRSSATFPVEIFEEIIDFCGAKWGPYRKETYRKEALRACALTCRSWLHRSRWHLFYHVGFDSEKKFSRFLDVLNSNPELGTFVKNLVVHQNDPIPQTWINLVADILPSKLTKLGRISFFCFSVEPLQPSFYMLLAQFTTVTSITICNPRFASTADLMHLIQAFPNLISLFLDVDRVSPEASGPQPPLLTGNARRPPLQNLSIVYVPAELTSSIIKWLVHTPAVSSLVMLHIVSAPSAVMEDLGQLIRSCAATLECVTLHIPGVTSDKYRHLDLSRNANLRELVLKGIDASDLPKISAILSAIAPRRLKRIELLVDEPAPERFDAIDWQSLEIALASTNFVSLTTIKLTCQTPGDEFRASDVLAEQITSRLPALHERGILQVSVQ